MGFHATQVSLLWAELQAIGYPALACTLSIARNPKQRCESAAKAACGDNRENAGKDQPPAPYRVSMKRSKCGCNNREHGSQRNVQTHCRCHKLDSDMSDSISPCAYLSAFERQSLPFLQRRRGMPAVMVGVHRAVLGMGVGSHGVDFTWNAAGQCVNRPTNLPQTWQAVRDNCPTLCAKPPIGALSIRPVRYACCGVRSRDLTGRGVKHTEKRTPH